MRVTFRAPVPIPKKERTYIERFLQIKRVAFGQWQRIWAIDSSMNNEQHSPIGMFWTRECLSYVRWCGGCRVCVRGHLIVELACSPRARVAFLRVLPVAAEGCGYLFFIHERNRFIDNTVRVNPFQTAFAAGRIRPSEKFRFAIQ